MARESAKVRPLFLAVLAAMLDYANAAATLTSTGCADSSGMDKCAASVEASFTHCIAQANGDKDQILGCGCAQYIGNYNCYATSCWNRVFECEYQNYVAEYFGQCSIAKLPVPYFPAPDGVPDACSCNLGKVLNGIDTSVSETTACQQSHGLDAQANLACSCCGLSALLSSIHNFCPTTDPSLLGFNPSQSQLDTFNTCSASFSQSNCASDLAFDSTSVGGTFFGPNNLPASGTATLSNLPGTVTAPANGPVFTYTNGGDGQTYTISAANFKAGSGGSGSSSGSSTSSGSGSNSGSGTSGSTANSAVKKGLSGMSVAGSVVLLNLLISYL